MKQPKPAKPKVTLKPKAVKKSPIETKRVGGIISVPVKPKKTIY